MTDIKIVKNWWNNIPKFKKEKLAKKYAGDIVIFDDKQLIEFYTKIDKIKTFIMFCDNINSVSSFNIHSNTYSMGVTDIDYDIKTNEFIITLRRPGILIGRRGSNINKLEKLLESKIVIVESVINCI